MCLSRLSQQLDGLSYVSESKCSTQRELRIRYRLQPWARDGRVDIANLSGRSTTTASVRYAKARNHSDHLNIHVQYLKQSVQRCLGHYLSAESGLFLHISCQSVKEQALDCHQTDTAMASLRPCRIDSRQCHTGTQKRYLVMRWSVIESP